MHIVILNNTAWNVFNFREGIVKKLLEKHTVTVVSPSDGYEKYLQKWGCNYISISMNQTGMNLFEDSKYLWFLYKTLKHLKPDYILSFTIKPNIYGSLAAKSLRIPIICNISGLGTLFLWKGFLYLIGIQIYRFAFRYSTFLFFQNPDDQHFFNQQIGIKKPSAVIPGSGINLTRFSPTNEKVDGNRFKLLMISRLIIEKGVIEYIEAAQIVKKKYPNIEFFLLGSYDPQHARTINLEAWELINKGQTIQYLPPTDDVRTHISKCDGVVLPSYREGTPKTLLEAAAMAKPVITTDVPGCKQVVDHGINGYLVSAKNADALADALIQLYKLPLDEKIAMGVAGRKKMENEFNEQLIIEAYLNIMNID